MSYCTDFICTYHLHDEEEKDIMYRSQFLQAFSLDKWSDDIINNITEELYNELKHNDIIKMLFDKIKTINIDNYPIMLFAFNSSDCDLILFKMLFSYHFFNLIHNIICNYKNNGCILNNDIELIIEKIKSVYNII